MLRCISIFRPDHTIIISYYYNINIMNITNQNSLGSKGYSYVPQYLGVSSDNNKMGSAPNKSQ